MSTINPVNTAQAVQIFEGPAAPTRVQAIVSKIQTIWFNFVETMKSLFESIRNLPANTKARYNAWLETRAVAQEEGRFQAMMKDKKAFERSEAKNAFEGMWALAQAPEKASKELSKETNGAKLAFVARVENKRKEAKVFNVLNVVDAAYDIEEVIDAKAAAKKARAIKAAKVVVARIAASQAAVRPSMFARLFGRVVA